MTGGLTYRAVFAGDIDTDTQPVDSQHMVQQMEAPLVRANGVAEGEKEEKTDAESSKWRPTVQGIRQSQ